MEFPRPKADPFVIDEGPPRYDFAAHPAANLCKIQPPDQEDVRRLYVAFTGREPPTTIAEWKARILEQGGEIPPYAQDVIDDLKD